MNTVVVEGRDLVPAPPRPFALPGGSVGWALVGNVGYALCQWGMLVVLARAGDTEMVGRFALALAISAPVLLFANLQLREVLATDARGENSFGEYLSLRLATTGLALIAIAGITWVAGYPRETTVVVLLIALAKGTEAMADICHGLLQREDRMPRIACSMLLRGGCSLLAVGVGVLATGRLAWGVLGLALAWALVLVGFDLPAVAAAWTAERAAAGRSRARARASRLGELTRACLPLGIVAMLMSLGTNVPRYFIEGHWGERELGVFAALAYLIVATTTVASAVERAVSPRLARRYAEGRVDAVRGLLGRAIGAGAVCGGVGILLALVGARPLLAVLYGPEYAEYSPLLVWVMVAAALSCLTWPLNGALVALRELYPQAVVTAINLAGLTVLCWLLVPRYALAGAVVAMIASSAGLFVARAVVIERHLRAVPGPSGTGR